MTERHELFEELDAWDPRWTEHYASVRMAAIAAGLMHLFHAYRGTPAGQAYERLLSGVPDAYGAIQEIQNGHD